MAEEILQKINIDGQSYKFRGVLNEGSVTPDMLSPETIQILGARDKIVNCPDGEDLMSAIDENGVEVLRLKDRIYDGYNPNGMGYVILRKNKTFAEQVTRTNTIYEIRYDFDLTGADVVIPNGCVLKFEGGIISNGKLIGSNTDIVAPIKGIFNNVFISGSWNAGEAYPEWFINDMDDALSINQALNLRKPVILSNKVYNIYSTIQVPENSIIRGCQSHSTYDPYDEGTLKASLSVRGQVENVLFLDGSDIKIENICILGRSLANNGIVVNRPQVDGHDMSYLNISITDIYCNGCLNVGITMNACLSEIRRCYVAYCNTGIKVGRNYANTTITLDSCYCYFCTIGYDFNTVTYSSFNKLGCDNCVNNGIAYRFSNIYGVELSNVGSEVLSVTSVPLPTTFALFRNNIHNLVINNVAYTPNPKAKVFVVDSNAAGSVKISNLFLDGRYHENIDSLISGENTKLNIYTDDTINRLACSADMKIIEDRVNVLEDSQYRADPDAKDAVAMEHVGHGAYTIKAFNDFKGNYVVDFGEVYLQPGVYKYDMFSPTKEGYDIEIYCSTKEFLLGDVVSRTYVNTVFTITEPMSVHYGFVIRKGNSISDTLLAPSMRKIREAPLTYLRTKGTTAQRPTFETNKNVGFMYIDTTLSNKPIWWTGANWVDATGAEV